MISDGMMPSVGKWCVTTTTAPNMGIEPKADLPPQERR
jgi:hypothetical protein